MPPRSDFVTSAQACDLLGCDRSTLIRWVQAGKVRPVHKAPGIRGPFLYRRRDIEAIRDARAEAEDVA